MNDIEITVKMNGEEVPLSTISDETIKKIKEREKATKYEIYIRETPVFYEHFAHIIEYKGTKLVAVPLPNANDKWTFAAFTWVRDFCKYFECHSIYPVHGHHTPQGNYLYINIPVK
jgi:hypothetical protein